ncbi:atrophin-1-like, partial [Heptranchias perlo]|uniref:atrophin-1-like n=1 Tax=Heptranchias perlo TaxID=212740 RepID=UPI00355966C7
MFKAVRSEENGAGLMEGMRTRKKDSMPGLRGGRRKVTSSPEPRASSRSSEEALSRGRVSPGAVSTSSNESKSERPKPPLKMQPVDVPLDLNASKRLRERPQSDDDRADRGNRKKAKMREFAQPPSPSDLDSLDSNSVNDDLSSDPRDIDQDNRSTSPSIASPGGLDSDSDSSVSQCPLPPRSPPAQPPGLEAQQRLQPAGDVPLAEPPAPHPQPLLESQASRLAHPALPPQQPYPGLKPLEQGLAAKQAPGPHPQKPQAHPPAGFAHVPMNLPPPPALKPLASAPAQASAQMPALQLMAQAQAQAQAGPPPATAPATGLAQAQSPPQSQLLAPSNPGPNQAHFAHPPPSSSSQTGPHYSHPFPPTSQLGPGPPPELRQPPAGPLEPGPRPPTGARAPWGGQPPYPPPAPPPRRRQPLPVPPTRLTPPTRPQASAGPPPPPPRSPPRT